MLKQFFISVALILVFNFSKAQIGTGFLYSSVHSNFTVSYNSVHKFWDEALLSMDVLASDFSPEFLRVYNIVSGRDADLYGAAGGRFNIIPGVVLASGINAYPFENQNFGFSFEAGLMIDVDTDRSIFRGSFGFRYPFNR